MQDAYIKPQFRVTIALILREIHTLYGHTSLGYVWALIQTAFGITVFWVFRIFLHFKAPHGLTILAYLVAGFGIWNIVSQTITKSMKAVDGNRPLLTFPQVTPVDIMIARAIVIWGTQVTSMSILLTIGVLFGYPVEIFDPGNLMLAMFLAVTLGLGLGSCLGALASYMPALHNIVPMVMRILFFASGVFFSVTMFSKKVGDFLLWNPIMQLIELTRSSMSRGYVSPYVDIPYLIFVTLAVLTLGLLLERYTRKRQQS